MLTLHPYKARSLIFNGLEKLCSDEVPTASAYSNRQTVPRAQLSLFKYKSKLRDITETTTPAGKRSWDPRGIKPSGQFS